MFKFFIDRPVMSTVISIIVVLMGILGLLELPVTQYPDIAPPTVQVSASFSGANADTVLESVVIPIEQRINGVEGMTYMASTASAGSASISVFFEQGVDADIAAVNVQNRVARAYSDLPEEVISSGITTAKRENSALLYAGLVSTNPEYDDTFLQNYLNINVRPALQRINGVGDVNNFASRSYSIRVWMDPVKMASYNLVPADVRKAIDEQSVEAAAGALGQNAGESFEYVIRYGGRYSTAEQYGNVILKAENGSFLRLKDVAKVELNALTYNSLAMADGHPSISFGVFQTPGSNAQEVIEEIYRELDELRKDFPAGVDYIVSYDTNKFLSASIAKVLKTLVEAFLLVFLVVFVFLQDFRSTLIPAIAVPVSIIGTFFFLGLLGYSINMLTLFALLLAIGIVVDDAIVVVEAVHAKLEGGATDPHAASVTAMNEIGGAIVAITLVMAAVFVPITFIKGPTGVFYEQFGVTLIIAILLSAVNALTLSPALCAIFLKPHGEHDASEKKSLPQRFYTAFNAAFDTLQNRYIGVLQTIARQKWIAVLLLALCGAAIAWFDQTLPKGFVPKEDRGVIFVNAELPLGASMDRSFQLTQDLYEEIADVQGIDTISLSAGSNFFSGAGSSNAMGFIALKDWDERTDDDTSVEAIIAELTKRASKFDDANIVFFTPPSVPGFGSADGFEARLLDRNAHPLEELDATAEEFVEQLVQQPEIAFASNPFSTEYPQLFLDVDVARAAEAGVTVREILALLQGYVAGIRTAKFTRFGRQYRVVVQSLPEDRVSEESLNSMFIRTSSGQMTPVSQFVTLERTYGPQSIERFNMYNSVGITGTAAPGYSSGDAIAAVQRVAEATLPLGYDVEFSGLTREEIASAGQAGLIFLLSLVFVFFLLAAQYESYLLPLAVIFSLPVGVAGAFFTTWALGLENNIYFQIALIMLVGLLSKNGILIVEFAVQRRRAGLTIPEAALDAARVRLRPILMTSFAFVMGLMPLVISRGVGAAGNQSIGSGAVGGLFFGTVVGVFVIPILFIIFQSLQESLMRKKHDPNPRAAE